jgi:hypothetical protein
MKDLSTRLRDADPVRLEPGLTAEARDTMRRAIVAAAEANAAAVPQWRQRIALAAMTVFAVAGAATAHRFAEDRETVRGPVPNTARAAATKVDFRTPGGTRIIWTIDPAFQLAGARP